MHLVQAVIFWFPLELEPFRIIRNGNSIHQWWSMVFNLKKMVKYWPFFPNGTVRNNTKQSRMVQQRSEHSKTVPNGNICNLRLILVHSNRLFLKACSKWTRARKISAAICSSTLPVPCSSYNPSKKGAVFHCERGYLINHYWDHWNTRTYALEIVL